MGEGGTPLIFIPGFAGDINIFVFNQEALSSDRAVYALDMPGHGRSAKDVGEGDLDFFAGVVAGFLDEMGIEKAHLAGHSIGGAIAGTFALAHPERSHPSSSSLALVWGRRLTPTTSRASSRPTGAEK